MSQQNRLSTVADLIAELQKQPQDALVYIPGQFESFIYANVGIVESEQHPLDPTKTVVHIQYHDSYWDDLEAQHKAQVKSVENFLKGRGL